MDLDKLAEKGKNGLILKHGSDEKIQKPLGSLQISYAAKPKCKIIELWMNFIICLSNRSYHLLQ